jgi:uncharacterized cupredoxin-like copper-binding protein
MQKFSRLSLLAVVVLAVALTACGGGGGGAQPAAGKVINVDATEFEFSPKAFSGTVGEKLTFKINNKGTVDHNFVILNAGGSQELTKTTVKVGSSALLDFTPPAAGDYQVDCNLPGHKEAGMVGKLTVK